MKHYTTYPADPAVGADQGREQSNRSRQLADAVDGRRLQVLMSMPCAGYGVGRTCRSLLRGLVANGQQAELFTSRSDHDAAEPFPLHSFTPGLLRRLPFPLTRGLSTSRLHAAYLRAIGDRDIAYLWPSAPTSIYEELRRRGQIILTEAINTRIRHAKAILDAAYDEIGMPPTHGLTDERIAAEEHRLSLCTAVFSPSPATDESFASVPAIPYLPTSYGTDVTASPRQPARRGKNAPMTALFVGSSPVRKGLHHLLEVWRTMPAHWRLRIVGLDDGEFARRYADVLSQPNVSATGFSNDVAQDYREADLFLLPSLEEGDPIVTYEAADHGLPILASSVGAGRIGAETGAVFVHEPADLEGLRDRIADFLQSADLRDEWGERAKAAVQAYDWRLVSARRMAILDTFLKGAR